MSRLPLVPEDAEDARLKKTFGEIRGHFGIDRVPELYRTLANAPEMLRAWTRFAWPLRTHPESPRGLRELVIMRVAQLTDTEVEWQGHWPLAVQHGITAEKLAALGRWQASDAFSEEERIVLRFTDEITSELEVSDATFEQVARRFPPGEVVELTLTASFYSCVSRVLRTLAIAHYPDRSHLSDVMRSGPE